MEDSMVETKRTASELVRDACQGNGPLTLLTREDMLDLVALFSPHGTEARDQLFRDMRDRADEDYPCRY